VLSSTCALLCAVRVATEGGEPVATVECGIGAQGAAGERLSWGREAREGVAARFQAGASGRRTCTSAGDRGAAGREAREEPLMRAMEVWLRARRRTRPRSAPPACSTGLPRALEHAYRTSWQAAAVCREAGGGGELAGVAAACRKEDGSELAGGGLQEVGGGLIQGGTEPAPPVPCRTLSPRPSRPGF
jgi:hypothetical protein